MQRYSDLVLESCMAAGTLPGGVTVEEQTEEEVEVSIVRITDEEGEKAVGKPRGSYVTLTAPHMAGSDPEIDKRCAKALAKQLRAMMPKNNKQRPVLLVGLGNRSMTPDSLGPRTLDHVMVTRHLFSLWPEDLQKAGNVCAISPGVLGETGIESGEAVLGIVQQIKPAVVIAVDTLAAGDPARMATTVQLGNTGIAPGGGVGNRRLALDEKTLGVPVLALGVPLVVRADTLFEGRQQGLIVTPKDIDSIVKASAILLSRALNQALHPRLPKEMKELLASKS